MYNPLRGLRTRTNAVADGEKALTATPEIPGAIRDGWTPWPLLGGGSRDRILAAYNTAQSANYAWTYTHSPALRTVVDVIVRNVGQLDLRLYEEVAADERQPRPEHPAALSLRYPNEATTSDSFIRSLFKDYLLFNNAFALIVPAPGGQLSFERLPAHQIEVQGNNLFRAERYRFWRREGTWVDFAPEQVLHWHGENPEDPRFGCSILDTLRPVLAEDAALAQATIELAQSGLQEPTWVFRPLEAPEWSNAARAGFEEDLTNRMRRANSKPLMMEEGMELRSFGVSPRDAQMYEIRRWAIERVAAVYGVPLGMVGLAADVKDAQSAFYSDTLPPYCQEFVKVLNQRILVRVYSWTDGCFEFNLDEKLMGDDRLRSLVSATGRAVMLTNEARAKLNLPPVDTGDELVTPLNVLVGDNPKPSTDVMPPQKPGGPPQDGTHPPTPEEQGQAPPKTLPPASDPEEETASPVEREVRAILERTYARQERSWRNRKELQSDRFARELAADLATVTPGVDRDAAKSAAAGINEALASALETSDAADVFREARRTAERLAKMLVVTLGMDLKALRDLNVPDEVVWARAGFPPDQIDQMRAVQLSHDMLTAADAGDEARG